jgi:hypothetical protein
MEAIAVLIVLAVLFLLALLAGVDSRDSNPRCHTAWWPGEKGRQ